MSINFYDSLPLNNSAAIIWRCTADGRVVGVPLGWQKLYQLTALFYSDTQYGIAAIYEKGILIKSDFK